MEFREPNGNLVELILFMLVVELHPFDRYGGSGCVREGERYAVRVNFNYLVVIQLHIIKHLIFCMYERRLFSQCLIYYQFASVSLVRLDLSTSQWQHVDAATPSTHHMHTLCAPAQPKRKYLPYIVGSKIGNLYTFYTPFAGISISTQIRPLTDAHAFQQYAMQNV